MARFVTPPATRTVAASAVIAGAGTKPNESYLALVSRRYTPEWRSYRGAVDISLLVTVWLTLRAGLNIEGTYAFKPHLTTSPALVDGHPRGVARERAISVAMKRGHSKKIGRGLEKTEGEIPRDL